MPDTIEQEEAGCGVSEKIDAAVQQWFFENVHGTAGITTEAYNQIYRSLDGLKMKVKAAVI